MATCPYCRRSINEPQFREVLEEVNGANTMDRGDVRWLGQESEAGLMALRPQNVKYKKKDFISMLDIDCMVIRWLLSSPRSLY